MISFWYFSCNVHYLPIAAFHKAIWNGTENTRVSSVFSLELQLVARLVNNLDSLSTLQCPPLYNRGNVVSREAKMFKDLKITRSNLLNARSRQIVNKQKKEIAQTTLHWRLLHGLILKGVKTLSRFGWLTPAFIKFVWRNCVFTHRRSQLRHL